MYKLPNNISEQFNVRGNFSQTMTHANAKDSLMTNILPYQNSVSVSY